jgi:PAS domain S-box-containing protein
MEDPHRKLFSHVQSSILPCVAVDTHSGVIVAANTAASQLLSEEELHGRDFAAFLAGRLPELIVFTEKVDHYKTSWTRDLSLVDAHGQEIPTEIHGTMINHDTSSFLVMQIIDIGAYETRSQNVSTHNLHARGLMEWDRARDFFREMENENRLILDAAGEGIYGINLEGKTTFVNKAAQEMLGWTKEDLLGEDIHAMIHHHHLDGRKYPSRECPIYHSFRNEQVNRVEDEVFWHKNGRLSR